MTDPLVAVVVAALLMAAGGVFGALAGYEHAMRDALDRGLAVQCVGTRSIYWECPE